LPIEADRRVCQQKHGEKNNSRGTVNMEHEKLEIWRIKNKYTQWTEQHITLNSFVFSYIFSFQTHLLRGLGYG
jgi:hypothetical protein